MDEHAPLWAAYTAALRDLSDSNRNGSSNSLAMRRNYEQRYGIAYRELVRAGLMPRLRRKYRGS